MQQTYWIAVLALPWGCLGQSQISVNLSSTYNRWALVTDGSYCPGGLDGYGNCYSANVLGSVVVFNGTSFTLGQANLPDAVTSATVALPVGQYSTMTLLATGVNGNQASQNLTVNYTDGTSTPYFQSFSDWYTPQYYVGEGVAATTAYRDTVNGTKDYRTFLLYGYSFALNGAKTVQSVTLPANSDVLVFAITLTAGSPNPPTNTSSGMYSISGIVINSGATVTLSGSSSASTGTNAFGYYSFSGLQNGSYVVAPSNPGYIFSPSTAMLSINNGSATGVNFIAIAAPIGQGVQPVSHSVSLTWNPTTSPNITGYNVYRASASGGPYTLLTASPIGAVSYLDSNVAAGLTYYYVATTVQAGNESTYSNQATAVIPTP